VSKPVHYATATAFRQALEARLKNIAQTEQVDIQRLRRQLAFDRFLCRLFRQPDAPWALKGGYAMELRIATARTTRDIDLSLRQHVGADGGKDVKLRILDMLQSEAAVDLDDFFVFTIGEPLADLDAAPYGGGRFPVESRMDGRVFAKFHIDVGAGDVVINPLEAVRGRDWLDFVALPSATFPAISVEQQFAEKFHAYTLPQPGVENTRTRDLVDMILLIRLGLDPEKTLTALAKTFQCRGTHKIPAAIAPPPDSWARPFAALAKECGLADDMAAAFLKLEAFISDLPARRSP
jgi:hypothetical protein